MCWKILQSVSNLVCLHDGIDGPRMLIWRVRGQREHLTLSLQMIEGEGNFVNTHIWKGFFLIQQQQQQQFLESHPIFRQNS